MKKIIALILAMLLIFASTMAIAEVVTAEPDVIETTAPLIDFTEVVISMGKLILSFIAVWFAKTVVPPIKKWLDARTTNEQRATLYNFIDNAVEAAEQVIGKGKGSEKLDYVVKQLEKKGYTVDMDMIEAAVKRMNDMALLNVHSFLMPPDDEETEPSDEEADEDTDPQT